MRRLTVLAPLFGLMLAMPAAAPGLSAASAALAPLVENRLKASFDALAEPERRAIQDALLWTGNFVGVVNGAFGPRTRDALAEYARRTGVPPETALDPKGRDTLLNEARAARADVGFVPLRDKQTGAGLSLPLKLLPRRTATDSGTRYASSDGALVVDVLSRPVDSGGLAEAFDRISATSAGRKITYRLLKPDFFVVSGEIGDRKFYARFVSGVAEGRASLRGLTVAYPKSDAARLDIVALAAAAAFDAFPSAVVASPAPTVQSAEAPPAASFTITGITVAPGLLLTHVPGPSCMAPSVKDGPIVLRKQDTESGLALFESLATAGHLPARVQSPAAVKTSTLALFKQDPDGLDVASAMLDGSGPGGAAIQASVGIQGRPDGVPLVDRRGDLVGLLAASARPAPSTSGLRLETGYPMIDATRIRSFLQAQGVAVDAVSASPPTSLGALTAMWRPLLVSIICRAAAPL